MPKAAYHSGCSDRPLRPAALQQQKIITVIITSKKNTAQRNVWIGTVDQKRLTHMACTVTGWMKYQTADALGWQDKQDILAL